MREGAPVLLLDSNEPGQAAIGNQHVIGELWVTLAGKAVVVTRSGKHRAIAIEHDAGPIRGQSLALEDLDDVVGELAEMQDVRTSPSRRIGMLTLKTGLFVTRLTNTSETSGCLVAIMRRPVSGSPVKEGCEPYGTNVLTS